MTGLALAALTDRRVLVVEDEYMIAQEIAEALSDAGAETLGPVPRISDAMRLVTAESRIDGALLDVNLGGEAVWPLVDMLLARSVPILLASGYDASAVPLAYTHLPRCEKPATGHDLARALVRVLAA